MSTRGDVPSGSARAYPARELVAEEPIELRRNLDALRRARLFIVLLVAAVTVTAVVVSLLLPKTYRATATIVLQEDLSPFGSADVNAVIRQLATIERLLRTPDVLAEAAQEVPGESRTSLEDKVTSSVDSNANIIRVAAVDDTAQGAADIANAVARTFLEEQAAVERRQLADASTRLEQELTRLQARGGGADEISALRERIIELNVSQVSAGSDLQLAQAAEPPSDPYTPRPLRNGVLAFFGGLFLAVLIALGRDRLVPRIGGARELSRVTNLPILAGVPHVRHRFGRRPQLLNVIANEAYQTLQASIRFQLPPDRQRVILVTSAVAGEGKSNVAAGLGRALARVGEKTLLVSADLRFPTLHELFETGRSPGFAEILESNGSAPRTPSEIRAAFDEALRTSVDGGSDGNLDLIPSGNRPSNPATLLFSDALDGFFGAIASLPYSYVIVDGAPLLGIADSHALAKRAGSVVIVSRLERVTLEDVIEMRDVFDRLAIDPLGLVVVGAPRASSYIYADMRPEMVEEMRSGRIPA